MKNWRDYLCVFPDDGDATLDRVLAAMPEDLASGLSHSPIPCFRLSLASDGAAVALVLGVPGVVQVEGLAEHGDVLVPWRSRAMCEQQIIDLNHGPAHWTRLERIEAGEESWETFCQHWIALAEPTAPAASI